VVALGSPVACSHWHKMTTRKHHPYAVDDIAVAAAAVGGMGLDSMVNCTVAVAVAHTSAGAAVAAAGQRHLHSLQLLCAAAGGLGNGVAGEPPIVRLGIHNVVAASILGFGNPSEPVAVEPSPSAFLLSQYRQL